SCSSTWVGTHRYSGDDSQSGSGTQAHIPSDDKRRAQLRFHRHSRRTAAAATSVCATAQFRQSLFFGQSCAFLDKLSDIFGVSPNSAPTAFDFAIRLGSAAADLKVTATTGPTPGTVISRRQTASSRTIASTALCSFSYCACKVARAESIASAM